MSRPAHLIRAFVRSATEHGGLVAKNAWVETFTSTGGRVLSVAIRDCQTGALQEIAASQFALAVGPWTAETLARALGSVPAARVTPRHAWGLNLVLGRRLADVAIGVRSKRLVAEDPIGGGHRFLFLVPQEETTLVGTWYGMVEEGGLEAALEQGRRDLLADVDRACPGLGLTSADVIGLQWGRLPLDRSADGRPARLADRPIISGPAETGLANLFAAETVKFTTARAVAAALLDRIAARLPTRPGACRTAEVPLVGAELGATG
jgi:glycerol-3-phosphate dehydrogenase